MTKKEWVQAHFPEFAIMNNFGKFDAFYLTDINKLVYSAGNGKCPRDFDLSDFNCGHSTGNKWLCECCWNEEIEDD